MCTSGHCNDIHCFILDIGSVLLKKSGGKTPRVELMEIGPRVDLCLRRTRLAKPDRLKEACRKPRAIMVSYHMLYMTCHCWCVAQESEEQDD